MVMNEWHLWQRQDLISNKEVIHLLLSVCRALGALYANKPYKKQQHRYPMAQEEAVVVI